MLKTDIPFARDDANRFLPWMIALMSAIAALMLLTGITFGQWVAGQQGHYNQTLTVQVPPQEERTDAVLKQVAAVLSKTPGLGNTTMLDEEQVRALVQPWLGNDAAVKSLPLPTVIDAEILSETSPDIPALERRLRAIAADISVDTQALWAEKFSSLSRVLQTGLYGLAVFVIAALGGMMVFTARAAIKLHSGTVLLLHTIGAEDAYIARQFQANALRLAIRGAVPGTLLAGVVYIGFGFYASHLDAPLLPGMVLSFSHILILFLLPLACCGVSLLAVRAATMAQLRKLC